LLSPVRPKPSVYRAVVLLAIVLLAVGVSLSGASMHVDELGQLAFGLTVVVTAALAGGHLAARIGQPPVLGEILAGVLLGNLPGLGGLHSITADPHVDMVARVGMLLLLFEVGVELSVADLFAVGASSLLVAVLGTSASLAIGTTATMFLMPAVPFAAAVFIGAAITATSVGITARVLRDMRASRSKEAKLILGAAILDDVLALVVLSAVSAWATSGSTAAVSSATTIAALLMKTVGFLVLAISLGVAMTPAWFRLGAQLRTSGALLSLGLCLCFFLSWAASAIGLAALVGAFTAGLVLEDSHSELFVRRGERPLGELLQPMTSFLVPVFFVLVGFRMNLAALMRPELLTFALLLTAAAILGKLACAGGVLSRGVNRLTVAFGMMPRGEVTLVFAAMGTTLRVDELPLLDDRGYAALVTVVILTTLATPPALEWSLLRRGKLD